MKEPKILVTGAPGGIEGASTAGKLVRLLREDQVPVRAFVHRAGSRSEALAQVGAEIHVGDMLDIVSVRAAMKGIEKVFFCYPAGPGFLEAAAIIAQAGKEAHIKFLVNLSQGAALDINPSPSSRKHWLSERIFDWSGIPVFHLRGGVFFEHLFRQFAKDIAEQGQVRAPFGSGEGKIPLVASQDISRVARAALLDPGPFIGNTFLIFSESLSLIDVARQASEALQFPVSYHEISSEDWIREETIREGSKNPERLIHHVNVWKFLLIGNQSGKLVDLMMSVPDFILKFTGQSGQSLKSWLDSEYFERFMNLKADEERVWS